MSLVTRWPPRGKSPSVRPSGVTRGLLVAQRMSGSCQTHQGRLASLQVAGVAAPAACELVSAPLLKPYQCMEINLCTKDHWREREAQILSLPLEKIFPQERLHPSHRLTLKMPRQVEHPV